MSLGASTVKHGLLTVEAHREHLKQTGEFLLVSVDGVDVTEDCHEANDIEGTATVFCRDAHPGRPHAAGKTHVNGRGETCWKQLRGDVVIAPRAWGA